MTIQPYELVYPMAALVVWTFLVMFRNTQIRVGAVLRGQLSNEYFELFHGAEPSPVIVKTANHLRNLCEFPPLFYAASLAIMLTGKADSIFVILAWSYVGLRVMHSLVHLTFNKVPPRFFFYLASNIVLLVMWLRLVVVL